jgi:small-conductance mechanosensitive channel
LIGFGLTIALQKPILNFVGWITIIFGKAYQIGDIISINTTTGKVYDIKAMYTNLAELTSEGDPSGKSISIPNEFVLTTPIINYTKGTPYVWDSIQFFITYQSDWKKAFSLFEKTAQNFYDKNIKKEVRKAFKENFDYAKIIARVNINEKGIILKARYLVDFNNANTLKTELVQELLSKLRIKGITLGKIEDIKSEYKTF